VELMDRAGAAQFAPQVARDARAALGQADDAYHGRSGKKRDVTDLCIRAIVLASEAMRETERKIEAQSAADEEAKRQAELSALGRQAAGAEQAREQSETALAEMDKERGRLESEKALLMVEHERLLDEREHLVERVAAVLGAGARTDPTPEGLVVSLPGSILFDRGASGLKSSARIVLAKLVGVLLMVPGATIRIEGHSDASGTHAANLRLSEDRARSVMAFLESEGVSPTRMTAEGLGSAHPIAPSDTPENRAKNRRVEIVLNLQRAATDPR
jgi:outer membrane protein OmpA-like peptidoglycan-associated protein